MSAPQGGQKVQHVTRDGRTYWSVRAAVIEDFAEHEAEHPNPNWTPSYRRWVARQVAKRAGLKLTEDE